MSFLLETVQVVIPDILKSPPLATSIVSISSQHFACSGCGSESESVASITFKLSSADGVKEFTLPPASSFELTQLAVLFGTSHTASQRVKFDDIPGFEVSFLRNSDTTVRVSFLADQQLMHFMGLEGSCSSVHATIAIGELSDLEDAIRASFTPCNK
jgi:hypothetical protein